MHPSSEVARFSQFVIGLQERSQELDPVELFRWFAGRLADVVGFDCCWCGWVDLVAGRVDPRATLSHNLPGDFTAFWQDMKADDLLARDVLVTGRVTARYDRGGKRQTEGMAALSDRYHLNRMAVATVHQDAGEPSVFLSPYRGGPHARSLGASELDFIGQALVHLKRITELKLSSSEGSTRLLVNSKGDLLFASRTDRALINEFWPAGHERTLIETLLGSDTEKARRAFGQRGLAVAARVFDCPEGESVIEIVLRPTSPCDALTAREREVSELIAEGRTHKEIARCLGLSPATVRNHTSAVYSKTGVGTRAALTRLLYGSSTH